MSTRPGIVIDAPFGKLHIAGKDVNDHAYMRANQLIALLDALEPPDGPGPTLWLAQQLANEVLCAICGMMGVQS